MFMKFMRALNSVAFISLSLFVCSNAYAFNCNCDYTYRYVVTPFENQTVSVRASTACPGNDQYKASCFANATSSSLTAICQDIQSGQESHNETQIGGDTVTPVYGNCFVN